MKRGIIVLAFLFSLLLVPYVSAEMYFDQLHSLYNVGDIVNANLTLGSNVQTSGFLTVSMICGIREIETHKSIQVLEADVPKQIGIVAVADQSFLGDLNQECYFRALYGAGEARSQTFKFSSAVDIETFVGSAIYNPGETINITGNVLKRNRDPLKGLVDIVVEGINVKVLSSTPVVQTTESQETTDDSEDDEENNNETDSEEEEDTEDEEDNNETASDEESKEEEIENNSSASETNSSSGLGNSSSINDQLMSMVMKNITIGKSSGEVIDGKFSLSIAIPEDAPPGEYRVTIYAYDKNSNGLVMNFGASTATMNVRQVINNIDIGFNANTIKPENNFVYVPVLYDQAGGYGEGDIGVSVYKPDKSLFYEKLIKAGEKQSIYIESNFSSGFWEIKAVSGDLEKTKVFFVQEYTKLSSTLENGELKVTNNGNIPYKGPIEIGIGNNTQVENINLAVGDVKSFKLQAPDGEYSISFSDGENRQSLGSTFLTGRAIGVDAVGDFLFGSIGVWLWTLLIVVLIVIILIFVRKIIKKKSFGKIPMLVTPMSRQTTEKDMTVKQPMMSSSSMTSSAMNAAPAMGSLMNQGSKQDATVIALKVRNLPSLRTAPQSSNSPLNSLDKALYTAKSAGSKIYVDGDYRIIIFAQLITKESNNDIKAIAVAKEIESIIRSHNETSAYKIDFGIGIHAGQIALESDNGRLKFVSLDNTISITKRSAESSRGSVLLSDQLHKRTLGKVRVDKVEGTSFWQLRRIPDRTTQEEFIDRFLSRQKRDR